MKKYEKVMDHIQLTEEMRSRIINRIQNTNLPKRKILRFLNYKKYILIATSFFVLLVGGVLLSRLLSTPTPIGDPPVQIGFEVVQVASAEELEKKVGFAVPNISKLPFSIESTSYIAYGTDLAEIIYEGQGKTAVLRKSIQKGNNSGIFENYEIVQPISNQDISGTLSGHSQDSLVLAVWQDGEISYSIFLSNGIQTAEWKDILDSMKS